MNDLDAFERRMKENLEGYEVPYNSADWVQMERALSSGVRGWGLGRAWTVGLMLAGGLLIGGTAYFLGRDSGVELASASTHASLNQGAGTNGPSPSTVNTTTIASTSTESVQPASEQPQGEPAVHEATPAPLPGTHAIHAAKHAKHSAAVAAPATGKENTPKAPESASLFRASVKEACPGSPLDFTVEHMPQDGIYLWNFGDGSFSNKPNPQHTFTKPGSYQVMLSMSSTSAGTIHNKPSSETIVIHETPVAAFNVVKQEYQGHLPTVHFDDRSQGAKTYLWDFGDGTVSTTPHPDHVYKAKGTYKVELTVTNGTGCEDRKVKEVRIDKDFNLGAPAAFSPNSDGVDETFMPEALHQLVSKFNLTIYDAAGALVYETDKPDHPWLGKLRNQGPVLAAGDYVWVVNVDTGHSEPETFTGKVKLVK